jgi:hypothetical protein
VKTKPRSNSKPEPGDSNAPAFTLNLAWICLVARAAFKAAFDTFDFKKILFFDSFDSTWSIQNFFETCK